MKYVCCSWKTLTSSTSVPVSSECGSIEVYCLCRNGNNQQVFTPKLQICGILYRYKLYNVHQGIVVIKAV